MLAIDTTRRPVRPRDWRAVLEAVVAADENDEQTWLEWKRTAQLRDKHDQVELICRHVLALANRQPEDAAKHVGGCGILILGLEPGTVHGLDPVDNADPDKWLSAYLARG